MKTKNLTCKECGTEFTHEYSGGGRHPQYCPTHRALRNQIHVENYRKTEKYRQAYRRGYEKKKETYDPWLWENTILEWDE